MSSGAASKATRADIGAGSGGQPNRTRRPRICRPACDAKRALNRLEARGNNNNNNNEKQIIDYVNLVPGRKTANAVVFIESQQAIVAGWAKPTRPPDDHHSDLSPVGRCSAGPFRHPPSNRWLVALVVVVVVWAPANSPGGPEVGR